MVYEPFELGGYRIPAGVDLIVSPLITQRDARWFDAPLEFRPERWTAEFREAVPQYAYPPFGGGPHKCIGEGFAWMEAKIALATLGQPRRAPHDYCHEAAMQPHISLYLAYSQGRYAGNPGAAQGSAVLRSASYRTSSEIAATMTISTV